MREPPKGLPPRLRRLWQQRQAQAANRRGAGEYFYNPERPGHEKYAQQRPGDLLVGEHPSDTRPVGPRLAPKGAPPKSRDGKTVSKAQQKLGFAEGYPWAHTAARRGPAYAALPEHKRRSRRGRR